MEELEEIEEDAGLGNGGLGRLAGKWRGECVLLSGQSVASQMLRTLDHAYRNQKGPVGGVQGVSWL